MSPHTLGIGLVFAFVISTAFRDIYFSGVFQDFSFFAIVLLAFPLCTLCFTLVTLFKEPGQLLAVIRNWRGTLALNVTSAAAWLSYFYALKTLEPSVVNTIHVGIGPITIIVLSGFGIHISRAVAVRQLEKWCAAGIVVILALLALSILAGWSQSTHVTVVARAVSLLFALSSGVFITLNTLVSKQMNEQGIAPEALLSVRFLLTIAIALVMTAGFDEFGFQGQPVSVLAMISLASVALLIVPIYLLQVGVAYTDPVTARVIQALAPVFVFSLQTLEGRVMYSEYTLIGIVLYAGFAAVSTLSRMRQESSVVTVKA